MSDNWKDFFEKIQYKPNVTIAYENVGYLGSERITVTMYVPDSRDPRNLAPSQDEVARGLPPRRVPLVPITASYFLDPWYSEDYSKHYIRDVLRRMEDHELDEWLRFDGKLLNDPHADEEAYDRAG